MSVATKRIDWPGPTLEGVIALHRADSRYLGFFPKGAFEEHAKAGQILLALNERDEVLGYLLYRIAKQRAAIVHLCTSQAARGQGIARRLVEHLKRETTTLSGICLHCRQDYDARHVWAKFGFTALHRRVGRSHDGHELTFCWFDHGHPDLFSLAKSADARRLKVVVDANVFFDLEGEEVRDNEDSKALLADWLQESIELCLTKEIYNEIDRASDPDLRRRSLTAVTGYSILSSDDGRFQKTCDELRGLFPEAAILRDESDLRQVAYAIVAEVPYFLTRDGKLAERCETLYERYGLQVLHPAELISSLDVLERESQYRPARIAGSQLQTCALKADDVERVVDAFREKTKERANEFRRAVLHCLSKPRDICAKYVVDREQQGVAFAVSDRVIQGVLELTILRSGKNSLGPTMLRNLLQRTIEAAAKERRHHVVVSDAGIGDRELEALAELGFAESNGRWVKTVLRAVGGFETLRDAYQAASITRGSEEIAQSTRAALMAAETANTPEGVAAIEARFWPAKVLSDALPTFIVSIRAEWAQHFFDDELASQFLFGTREELLLGIEGVYYCSAQHRHLTAPARVLWYVSKGNDCAGSMSIKACSRLEEVVVGKPKDLFKRFRRLGVFQWKDVFEVAKNDLTNDVLAFRFSMTERFANPFSLDQLNALAIRQPFLSPRRISDSQFAAIYSHGSGIE